MNDRCSIGKFKVDKTINIVTKEALGTLATPILVAVEIRLKVLQKSFFFLNNGSIKWVFLLKTVFTKL